MTDSILIVAGESSGEKYGAELVRQFKKLNPSVSFFGIGGKRMSEEGVELIFPIENLAVVGVFEVLRHIPQIKRDFNRVIKETERRNPLAAVLIDSPDFNLRLAKRIKALSIPVLYYVSPTVWVWRAGRLRTIKKTVDKMMLIFPFEEKIYMEHSIPAVYIGHPLKERVRVTLSREEFFRKYSLNPQKKLVALLPGSRKSEVGYHLSVLVKAVELIKKEYDVQFVLLRAENIEKDFLDGFVSPLINDLKILSEDHYEALASSDLALSACGTANLEAALLETPLIAFYRISPLTYFFGRPFSRIANFSIVNILAGKKVTPELIQKEFTAENIFKETKKILDSEELKLEMKSLFRKIKEMLGEKIASRNAALELQNLVRNRH